VGIVLSYFISVETGSHRVGVHSKLSYQISRTFSTKWNTQPSHAVWVKWQKATLYTAAERQAHRKATAILRMDRQDHLMQYAIGEPGETGYS